MGIGKLGTEIGSMKRRVSFDRDGLGIVGHLYVPAEFDEAGQYQAVIVQGSLTSVKEQMAGTYARKFASEGFVALTFDYSHYGESEGTPRQLESPEEKLADLKAAVSYLTEQPFVRSVGMVGVCTSAGNAAYLAAEDPRLGAVATIAGMLPEPDVFLATYGEDGVAARRQQAAAAREKYVRTGEATPITTYSDTDTTAANYSPVAGAYDYYENKARGNVPQYLNAIDASSWDGWLSFDPISKAPAISTPTIVVHSDGSAYPDQAKKFYAALRGEKELVWADGNHYDYYDSPAHIDNAVANVTRFFRQHLN